MWEHLVDKDPGEQRRLKRLPHHPSRRVLVVEDNVDVATSLALLLRRWEFDVETAYDGRTAVQTARRFRPDVVLLDIGLPDLDGYDVAKHLRREPWSGKLVLLAMTGSTYDPLRSREAGFDWALHKPIRTEFLRDLLTIRH
jgi:DNA-binding response OmpR family regulator